MKPISAIVLAGGESRRLGRDKRALAFDGRPMLAIAIDLVAAAADEVIVSCREDRPPDPALYEGRTVRLAFDRREGGPLAGLEASLAVVGHDKAVVVPVDMPHLTAEMLACLVRASARAGCQAAAFGSQGDVTPFPGVYRRSILPLVSAQLDSGRLRVRDLLERLDLAVVEPLPGALADAFLNVNTAADLARRPRRYDRGR